MTDVYEFIVPNFRDNKEDQIKNPISLRAFYAEVNSNKKGTVAGDQKPETPKSK